MSEPSAVELRALGETRLRESGILFDAGEVSGAYYLCGYAGECGLKSVIAQRFRQSVIPDRRIVKQAYRHNLVELVKTAGLEQARLWSIVTQGTETSRYEQIPRARCSAMLEAVSEPSHGSDGMAENMLVDDDLTSVSALLDFLDKHGLPVEAALGCTTRRPRGGVS